VKLNGFDKRTQHSQQTAEMAQVHRSLSSSSSSAPSETAVNTEAHYEDTDHNMNVVVHSIPGPDNGRITKNDSDPEPEPDSNDDTNFPSPPTSMLYISTAAEQDSCTADDVSLAHSVTEPDPTPAPDTESPDQPSASASHDMSTVSSVSSSSPLPPPPPPTAPPLPTSFSTVIPPAPKPSSSSQQQSDDAGARQTNVARPTQAKLEEMRRQEASHAALLAAVARRRSILDTTDAEQIAKSIENQIRRNSAVQMMFRANTSEQRRASVAAAGLLAPSDKPNIKSGAPKNTTAVTPVGLLVPDDKPDINPDASKDTEAPAVENGEYFANLLLPV